MAGKVLSWRSGEAVNMVEKGSEDDDAVCVGRRGCARDLSSRKWNSLWQ